MTPRRSPRRPISPVLIALFVGAAAAGTATVLARPTEVLASGHDQRVASFTYAQRPPVSVGQEAPRHNPPTTPATSTAGTAPATAVSPPPAGPPPTSNRPSQPAPPSSAPPAGNPADAAAQAGRVVELVNQARAANGCGPVQVNAQLTAAATEHSTDMANRDYFSHTSPEGLKFDDRIRNAGYSAPGAENIARGQQNADEVMDAWMKSAGHRENILNCQLGTIGVGVVLDGFYWTQDFGYPLPPPA